MQLENNNQNFKKPVEPIKNENIIDIDKILTKEEKEAFRKASNISEEFMARYELAKQKAMLETNQGKKM